MATIYACCHGVHYVCVGCGREKTCQDEDDGHHYFAHPDAILEQGISAELLARAGCTCTHPDGHQWRAVLARVDVCESCRMERTFAETPCHTVIHDDGRPYPHCWVGQGNMHHYAPHCRQCGEPMRSGALDTRGVGPNQRGWVCDPCQRSVWHTDAAGNAYVWQQVYR